MFYRHISDLFFIARVDMKEMVVFALILMNVR